MSKKIVDTKVEAVLNIHILREKSMIELKPRSGKLPPEPSPFGGMTGEGWGSVCCLTDLSVDELMGLRTYIDEKIKERVK